jgi:hypothetical protein
MFSEASIDVLMGYAYMQPGVSQVRVGLDFDEKNDGKKPRVIYKIRLAFWLGIKYSLANNFASKPGIFNKLMALFMIRIGSPAPKAIEATVARYAIAFLPKKYSVEVEIE